MKKRNLLLIGVNLFFIFLFLNNFIKSQDIESEEIYNNFRVTWYDCQHSLIEHSCKVDIQNLDVFNSRDFNLSSLISETNYNLSNYTTSFIIKEWKILPIEIPTYNIRLVNKTCFLQNNITFYDCSYNEIYQNGTEIKNIVKWKITKNNVFNILNENTQLKMYYGTINIPKINSKEKKDDYNITETINGTKTFLVEWTTPIIKTQNGWGSSGNIVFIDENTNYSYHPWWDTNWAKKKEIKIQGNFNDTNYTLLFNFQWSDFNNQSLGNFSDLRFLDSSETYELPYWFENKTNNDKVSVWVKVPIISQNINNSIYIYYNNTGAGYVGNENNTFVAYYNSFENWVTEEGTLTKTSLISASSEYGKAYINFTTPEILNGYEIKMEALVQGGNQIIYFLLGNSTKTTCSGLGCYYWFGVGYMLNNEGAAARPHNVAPINLSAGDDSRVCDPPTKCFVYHEDSIGTTSQNYTFRTNQTSFRTWFQNRTEKTYSTALGLGNPYDYKKGEIFDKFEFYGRFSGEVIYSVNLRKYQTPEPLWNFYSIPNITLDSPINNSKINYKNNIYFNFTVNDETILSSCELWGNWAGSWNKNYTWFSPNNNQQNFTIINISNDGNYIWNIWCNNTLNYANWSNKGNFTFTIDTIKPNLNITYPANTTYSINISALNYTIGDTNLQACWYTLNNGAINTTITCGNNVTGLTSNEGSNTWKVYANDSVGNLNSSSVTFFKDTIIPNLTISYPINNLVITSTTTSYNLSINFLSQDLNLDKCYFNITSDLGTNKATSIINCAQNTSALINAGSPAYIYNLTLCANDTSNNINCSYIGFSLLFSQIPSQTGSPGGGGGAPIVIVIGAGNWTMQTEQGTGSYILEMSSNSEREKLIYFQNIGTSEVKLKLSCESEDNSCKYVKFENEEITLPIKLDFFTASKFTILLPELIESKTLNFNVVATDEESNRGILSVKINIGVFGMFFDLIKKIFESKIMFGIKIPYILLFLFSFMIAFSIFNYLLFATLKMGVALSLIVSFILGIIMILVI